MNIETFTCEQGTPEWFQCRLGIPTASCFADVMAKGRGGEESKTRKTYMHKLAGELLTGEPMETYSNQHMERGTIMESEARAAYAFLTGAEPQQVGFVRNGRKGCSPDSLLESNGLLEIKTHLPHLLIPMLLKGTAPPEHLPQCQGQLWVTEREWLDLVCYWPKLKPLVVRIHRDEAYIKNLAVEVEAFNSELDDLVQRVRQL